MNRPDDYKNQLVPQARLAHLEPPKSQEDIGFAVGDLVEVEINGALVFPEPCKVRAIGTHSDGSHWVFVEGSETAFPLSQARKVESKPPAVKDESPATAIARSYLARGWKPLPVPFRTKRCHLSDWPALPITSENVHKYFNGQMNIGVQAGPASNGLTDNDLDCPEAIIIAAYVMPPTGAIFGRKSARNSHRLYYSNLAQAHDKADIARDCPVRKTRLCELRIGGGGKGAQTVFPGSVHEEGEPIVWEAHGEPATVDDDLLLRRFNLLAVACVLARHWPGPGARHEAAKVIGGFFARANIEEAIITSMVEGICRAAGDTDPANRKQAATDALKAFQAKKNTYGLPALAKTFGKEVADSVAEWLNYKEAKAKEKRESSVPGGGNGYRMEHGGLRAWNEKREKWEWISDPFDVTQRERSPSGDGWSRRLSWKDQDDREHTYLVSDARLHGEPGELCGELAGQGLTIALGKHRDLLTYINGQSSANRGTIVERTGWHEIAGKRCFVMPDVVVGSVDKVTLQGSTSRPYSASGTLEEWQIHIASKAVGHRYLTFMQSCGFVGPLLEQLELESGGVHPHGTSSIGKTTGVRMAVTPWGSGADKGGFLKSWSTTRNGVEANAVDHSDTLLAFEELGIANPKEIGACVYSLASGLGRSRAQRDGSLRAPKTWRIWVLSSGEVTLRGMMAAGGQKVRAGQEIRILDIRADQGDGVGVFSRLGAGFNPKAFADELKLATCRYYGTAGPAFVAKLLEQDPERIGQFWDKMRLEVPKAANLTSGTEQVMRVADKFSAIAMAGELAAEFGILPWQAGSATKAAAEMLDRWVKGRGGAKDPQEITAGIDQVRKKIAAFGDGRFAHADRHAMSKDDRPVTDRLGWFRGAGQDQRWLILPTVFRDVFCEGFDHTVIREALHAYGMLDRDPDGKHWPRNEKCDGRTQRVYVLTAKILQEEGAD
jgi:uncharacterized protein (DUF927 family)